MTRGKQGLLVAVIRGGRKSPDMLTIATAAAQLIEQPDALANGTPLSDKVPDPRLVARLLQILEASHA